DARWAGERRARPATAVGRAGRASGGGGEPGRAGRLEVVDAVARLEGEADVVEALEEAVAHRVVERELAGEPDGRGLERAALDVDGDLQGGVGLDGAEQLLAHLRRHGDRHQAVLRRVVAEDVAEPG